MSIITETGTGSATAETYISVTETDTYHAARGNAPWATITTSQKEQALRRATEYMTGAFRNRWQGSRKIADQALDWPRYDVVVEGWSVDSDIVPEIVKRATAELAIRAAAGAMAADLTQGIVREQVGPIAVEYDRNSSQATRYKAIDQMLLPFLKAGGGCSVSLVRV